MPPRQKNTRNFARAPRATAGISTPRVAPTWRRWTPALVVAVVAVAACLPGIGNDFVYDDILIILHDPRIGAMSRWAEFFTSPYWPPPHSPDLYRPVASLLMGLQFVIGAGEPMVFRLVSYALYVAACVGVYRLATRVVSRPGAFASGVLFAAHPVHVEAVALGVNQGELIVAAIATWALAWYIDVRRTGELRASHWAMLCAACGAAALTKENGLMLPALLAAAELCLVNGSAFRERVMKLRSGFAALAGVVIVVYAVRTLALRGNPVGAYTADAFAGAGIGGRMLTMLQVVPTWLRLLAWPAHLQADYGLDEIVPSTGFGMHEAAGLLIVAATVALAIGARRRASGVTAGLAWLAVALFPVSNVVPTSIVVAERTLLLPSLGFVLAAVAAVEAVVEALARRQAASGGVPSAALLRPAIVACTALVVAGVVRSARREVDWQNAARFWTVAAIDAPRSRRVADARAQAVDDLIRDFEPVIAQSPEPWRVRYHLAVLLRALNEDVAAVQQLQLALRSRGDLPDARQELAAAYLALGEYTEARAAVDSDLAKGDTAWEAHRLREIADSAATAGAPPGSVSLHFGHVYR